MSAEVDEIFVRIIYRKQIRRYLVNLLDRFDQSKHILRRNFILVVNGKVFQFSGCIRTGHICQLLIILNVSFCNLTLKIIKRGNCLKQQLNVVEGSQQDFTGSSAKNV